MKKNANWLITSEELMSAEQISSEIDNIEGLGDPAKQYESMLELRKKIKAIIAKMELSKASVTDLLMYRLLKDKIDLKLSNYGFETQEEKAPSKKKETINYKPEEMKGPRKGPTKVEHTEKGTPMIVGKLEEWEKKYQDILKYISNSGKDPLVERIDLLYQLRKEIWDYTQPRYVGKRREEVKGYKTVVDELIKKINKMIDMYYKIKR